ncbi:FAD-dependent oxidoreductase [Saccharopolyspora sp. CA-218241]|uniref:FAD-dependent oxidoreductase n=1 Tax=Saccharopolyspora sp. CA-218241 TaxID=3240027 RepID=UPI003D96D429
MADDAVDVLVVGGGVVGTGAALDAAARGLSVVLLEAEDLAWGSSRWSGKLLGGGLPAAGTSAAHVPADLRHARARAVERHVLMTRTAPHLTRTLPLLTPVPAETSRRTEALRTAALHADDALRRAARTPADVVPPPRRIPTAEALALVPGLRTADLRAALLGFTGQLVDDARLVVALARTAAAFGARVLTRVRVRSVDAEGADAVDERTGEALRVRARSVINAAGAWADRLAEDLRLTTRRSGHVLLDADAAGLAGTGLVAPGGLLLVPRPDGTALLSSAEAPATGAPALPESDVDDLLAAISAVLSRPVGREHVLGTFAGLVARPADHPGPGPVVRTSPDRVVTVLDAELTTYRKAAAEAVDAAVRAAALPAGPSRTTAIALVGATERRHLAEVPADPRLVAKYGTEAARVASLAELDPDLAERVAPDVALTAAEVLWAVRHEAALDAEDVLDRRSRIGLDPARRDAARPAVTALVERALHGVLAG